MIYLTYEQKELLKRYWWVLLLIFLLVTNPSHERHERKISKRYCERNPATCLGGIGGFIASKLTKYDDWYIFSYTEIADKTVSVGFCGIVFVFTASIQVER